MDNLQRRPSESNAARENFAHRMPAAVKLNLAPILGKNIGSLPD